MVPAAKIVLRVSVAMSELLAPQAATRFNDPMLIRLIFLAAWVLPAWSGAETLKDTLPFLVGVGIHDHVFDHPADWPLLTTQFACVTPENSMKPAAVQSQPGRWNFEVPDRFVEFARQKQLQVIGHCLIWAKDDRTPRWFGMDDGRPASRELMLDRMKTHIDTVVGHYRGRIAMWDVVNEALADGDAGYLRDSDWSRICGEEFIARAFACAHAADPDALLIYNDYNNELDGKRERMIRLIESLRAQQIPLHAIGLQGHYELDAVPFEALEKTLRTMQAMNMKVVISELDIDVIPRARWWANQGAERETLAKHNPYADGCPPEILQRQAEQYAQLFHLFKKYADTIVRVSFWNLHDGQSWLNDFPWKRVNHPLLFDRQGRPKPAFDAVLRVWNR
jgi:endo-1,4-beta-xylanase